MKLWFVDDIIALTNRTNWNQEALDILLERQEYCVPCPAQFEIEKPTDTSSCSACYIDHIYNEVRPGLPKALGMENGYIADNQIKSSGHNYNRRPKYARLNGPSHWGSNILSHIWIQVDLLSELIVTGIQTQGSATNNKYVKTLAIERGYNVSSLTPITMTGSNITKIFTANQNNHTVVNITFPKPVVARYVRIVVKSYKGCPVCG
ncbi:lactadherin-like [Amphiura filiformis]|uniref:lactadherin-like n=1 Tax=Amphiura filiformis TaxID=82378 RepID=UPI003B21258B